MHTSERPPVGMVGYQAASGRDETLGAVEAVQDRGLLLHRIPGFPGHRAYLPMRDVVSVDEATNTVTAVEGLSPAWMVLSPLPDDGPPRRSQDWWADLLGALGLFEPCLLYTSPSPRD